MANKSPWHRKRYGLNKVMEVNRAKIRRNNEDTDSELESLVMGAQTESEAASVTPTLAGTSTPNPICSEEASLTIPFAADYGTDDSDEAEDDEVNDPDVVGGDLTVDDMFREWANSLQADDLRMLTMLLIHILVSVLSWKVLPAAEFVGKIVGHSERTIRSWRRSFFYKNAFSFPQSLKGKYTRYCILDEEDVRSRALNWLRKESGKKKGPKLTVHRFHQWIKSELLATSSLPENAPKSISLRSAYRWMHFYGFKYEHYRKGLYHDGHERNDVVTYRKEYLRRLEILQATHKPPPLPSDGEASLPIGNSSASKELVLIYHDESVFHANEDHAYSWAESGRRIIKPKGQGQGLMVSDFIDEHQGYLRLTVNQLNAANYTGPPQARQILKIGANAEGFWTNDKFMKQVEVAADIATVKYPKESHTVVFLFDQSSNHRAFAEDALNVKAMNVQFGGQQPRMRDTLWNGKPQKMVLPNGLPKGLKLVLQERGVDTTGMKKDEMQRRLGNMDDFKYEKSKVEKFLNSKGYRVYFIPKYHCEINPIERVSGRAKLFTRTHCDYSFPQLERTVKPALDSVTLDDIRKYYRKVREYLEAYRMGKNGAEAIDEVKLYKSHRRVYPTES